MAYLSGTARCRTWPRLGRNPRSILMSCAGLSYPTNGVAMAMQCLRDERAPIATTYSRRLPTGDEGELVRLAGCSLFQCVREFRAALVFLKISGNGRTPVRLGGARCR